MTDMMVLSQGYALVFGPSDARKPANGWITRGTVRRGC